MMGVGVGCMDEKHITFDDRKKKRIRFDDRKTTAKTHQIRRWEGEGEEEEEGEEVRIKVMRTRVYLKAAVDD